MMAKRCMGLKRVQIAPHAKKPWGEVSSVLLRNFE